jgi:hypothetical protein
MKSLILSLVLLSFSTSAYALDGLYTISGKSSMLGDYSGIGWVYKGVVQRKVQYSSYTYKNNSVESIWSGTESNNTFNFKLSLSNALTTVEDFSPEPNAFAPEEITINQEDLLNNTTILIGDEELTETWTKEKDAGSTPLWQDLRSTQVGVGKQNFLKKVFNFLGLSKVVNKYRNLPELRDYQNRKEFIEEKQYFIKDKTDADFYLNTPNVLRVSNKTINLLSLTEAVMRKNAYGKTLAQKADLLGKETIKNNFNTAGFLEIALVEEKGLKSGRRTEYDTALWTSMFGWAELMRYQNTNDSSALNNFKKIIDGEVKLVEITENQKEFARGLAISSPEEDLGVGWIQASGNNSHLKYRKGGNNDMIKGVFITLILAHQALDPKIDADLIKRIQVVARNLNKQTNASHGENAGLAKGLDALWNKNTESFEDFIKSTHSIETVLGDITKLGLGFYVDGITDWSGVNLTMTSNICQILVTKELRSVFPDEPKLEKIQVKAESRLLKMHKIYKNAHRDFLTIMTYAFSKAARADAEFVKEARDAVWILKEVPAPRSLGNIEADFRKHPQWSYSAWPRVPWKALKSFRKLNDDYDLRNIVAGAYSYPLFEAQSLGTTYLWKEMPFSVVTRSSSEVQNFSADYLVLYWAGRSSGLITAVE